MAIGFRGRLDEETFRRAQAVHTGLERNTLGCLAVLGLFLLFGLISPLIRKPELQVNDFALPVGVVFAVTLFVIFYRRAIRKAWDSHRLLHTEFVGEADDEAVSMETEFSKSRVPWNLFLKRRLTGDLVMIYGAQNLFFLFPRSFFSSDADWQEFGQLVQSKVPAHRGGTAFIRSALLWCGITILVFLLWSFFGPK